MRILRIFFLYKNGKKLVKKMKKMAETRKN